MNSQQQAAFEAWAASIGFCVTGKYAETIGVLCAKSAFKAGYQAGRAALASPEVQALRDALKVANDALEEISNEMTFGARWTNAGQSVIEALSVTRNAIAQEES